MTRCLRSRVSQSTSPPPTSRATTSYLETRPQGQRVQVYVWLVIGISNFSDVSIPHSRVRRTRERWGFCEWDKVWVSSCTPRGKVSDLWDPTEVGEEGCRGVASRGSWERDDRTARQQGPSHKNQQETKSNEGKIS